MKLRPLLGRTRVAVDYVLGRQAMRLDVARFEDDVWLVSYPKSGNTWTRFLIANLIADDEVIDWTNIERRVPDIYVIRDPQIRRFSRPRYIKSHEPYRPEYRRVLLIVRDPRDVAVSYYHFAKKRHRLSVDAPIDEVLDTFVSAGIHPYGTWGENVGSWLGARRGTPNFWIVRYEDLLADTERQLAQVAQNLGLPIDNGHIHRAVKNSQADRLRQLEQTQRDQHKFLKRTRSDIPFVRAAKAGQWQTALPAEVVRAIESVWRGPMRELGYLD